MRWSAPPSQSDVESPSVIGSGKSSITPVFQNQPGFPQKYINPDEIALTLGGDTMSKAYEASAITAKERLKCIEQKVSFSFETVMSHPSKLAVLETAAEAGFETKVIFVSTENPNLNIDRVKQRVLDGGHNVPEDKIVSRYHRSLSYLPKAAEIADKTYIIDNSDSLQIKAVLSQGQVIEQPGVKIDWVEKTIATLNERRQEKLAIERVNPDSSVASLNRSNHTGKIKSVGKHFLVQQTKDSGTVIHENSILNSDESAVGHDVLINYRNGVHKISIPEISIDTSDKIEDTLFDLANSSKYIVLNRGIDKTSSEDFKVYNFPSGVTIEKSSESLSISYDDKLLRFDRDFNIIQNDFSIREIQKLNQQTQLIKQHTLKGSRDREIQIDKDLSI